MKGNTPLSWAELKKNDRHCALRLVRGLLKLGSLRDMVDEILVTGGDLKLEGVMEAIREEVKENRWRELAEEIIRFGYDVPSLLKELGY